MVPCNPTIKAAVLKAGLAFTDLELELTESLLMQNPEDVVVLLERLSAQGVHLSIDDFGTGYSSLSYLRRFPIDSLKIDQAFVRDMLDDTEDLAIVEGVLGLAMAFQREVIAEGVENRSQAGFLLVHHCELGQGFLMAQPMPPSQLLQA